MQEASKEQIQKWKESYGDVYEISVAHEDGVVRGYFKKPNRAVLSNMLRFVSENPMKSNEILFNGCKIECDEAMAKDNELFMATCGRLSEIIEQKEAEIKKL